MSNLEVFQGHRVRFVGTPEKPEWVGVDVVEVLYPDVESKNRSTYLRRVPDEWKGLQKVQTLGGLQDMITLYEPGMYCLIARSNSSMAIPFQKWIFEDVLPMIRKTGYYSVQQQRHIPPALEERQVRLEIVQTGLDINRIRYFFSVGRSG